ncbi:universal stress protein [Aestuariivirga sp.]|uniref:universal stress protein n=1 Tax=Aestuariivirga sp. TaxID=2650926 RepID=UPI0035942025
MHTKTAYLALSSYPEAPPDASILAAVNFVGSMGCGLHVTTFSVDIPQLYSPMGGLLLDVPALVRGAEEKSKAECRRLESLVQGAAGAGLKVRCKSREVVLGAALDAAAAEARYYELSVLPWSGETLLTQDMAQSVVFGSGRPAILVPSSASAAALHHIAIAWDGSRVAARALWDALALLPKDGRLTVLTIRDEKPLSGPDLAGALAASLHERGYNAKPLGIALSARTISEALQASALEAGAQLLAMGGFGHSRVRDFVLGGATKGVLNDLRMPILLSH